MAPKLPNLTVPAALAVALVAVGLWTRTDRSVQEKASADDRRWIGHTSSVNLADIPVNPQGLLERAIVTLESHRSLSAKVRQSGHLFGQELVGSGTYLQQRMGENLLFRLDLRAQVGNQTSNLAHVRDDQGHLWTYEDVPGEAARLSRIDVQRVEEHLQEMGEIERLRSVSKWPGLGGLSRLLRSLYETFDFACAGEAELTGQRPLPVWILAGTWNPQRLAQMLPESQRDAVVGGRIDLTRLPPQLPERVILLVGREDLFPYRLEFRRDTVPEPSQEPWLAQWFMTLDLFEVNFNNPLAASRFGFPTNMEFTDKTEAFLESLE